jgi:hypothetical protein
VPQLQGKRAKAAGPKVNGGLRCPRATAWQAPANQNIENNPMQSSRAMLASGKISQKGFDMSGKSTGLFHRRAWLCFSDHRIDC